MIIYVFTFCLHNVEAHYFGVRALQLAFTCSSNRITTFPLNFMLLILYVPLSFLFHFRHAIDETLLLHFFFFLYFKQIRTQLCCGSAVRKFGLCDEIVKSLKCLIPTLMKAGLKIGAVQTGKCSCLHQAFLVTTDGVKYRATKDFIKRQ